VSECSICITGYFLTPAFSCVDATSCPDGTYADLNSPKCEACDIKFINCAKCDSNVCNNC
jgi:hypothetical protein